MTLSRRTVLLSLASVMTAAQKSNAAGPTVVVSKDPNCDCCGAWAEHLRTSGFAVELRDVTDLGAVKTRLGVPGTRVLPHRRSRRIRDRGPRTWRGDQAPHCPETTRARGWPFPACRWARRAWKCRALSPKSTRSCCSDWAAATMHASKAARRSSRLPRNRRVEPAGWVRGPSRRIETPATGNAFYARPRGRG